MRNILKGIILFINCIIYLITPILCYSTLNGILYTPESSVIFGFTSWYEVISSIIVIIVILIFFFIINIIKHKFFYVKSLKYKSFSIFYASYVIIGLIIPSAVAIFKYIMYTYPDYNHWLFK
ncbi:hypothetical protein FACS1894132_13170 [Clostridia bacterium]|nr:hypothetical protein FACS1894132_13170 [Clostridia bacterium]